MVDVNLNVDNGLIAFTVGSVRDLMPSIPVDVTLAELVLTPGFMWSPPAQEFYLRREFSDCIQGAVANCRVNLDRALNHLQKFVYPGNGQFKFTNPILTKDGNLLADVSYFP